jgi:hypothetical protein
VITRRARRTGSRLGRPSRWAWASDRLSGRTAVQKGHGDGSEGLSCNVGTTAGLGEGRDQQGRPASRTPRGCGREGVPGPKPDKPDKLFSSARYGRTVSFPMRGGSGLSGLSGFNGCLWADPTKTAE